MKRKYCITAIIRDKCGCVISKATNSYIKTHPVQAKYAKKVGKEEKVYLHAEVLAILRAGKKIKKAFSIEIFRFDERGNTKLAKPCPICMELIKTTPIKEIRYTYENI